VGSEHDPYVFRGGPLANFAAVTLTLPRPQDGKLRPYASVEHYFQAAKAMTVEDHDEIADQPTPKDAKARGRKARLRPDWEDVKVDVMLTALRAKFSEEPFRRRLLGTAPRPIIEESRHDEEWGARRTPDGWHGSNLLGQLLMRVRDEIADDDAPAQLTLLP
jgi:N-glycosidase YbiA